MATGVTEVQEVRVREPLMGVQSRVSWGALLAGAAVAVAIYSLLTMLGIAIGFSVFDRFNADQLGTGAAIWAFATLLVAMFFGGWVTTQCTVGENRTEAILYGIIVWGITSSVLIPLTAAGVGMGFGTVLAERGITAMNNAALPPAINPERIGGDRNSMRDDRGSRDADRNRSGNEDRNSDRSGTSDRDRSNDRVGRDERTERTSADSADSDSGNRDADRGRDASNGEGSDRRDVSSRDNSSRDDRSLRDNPRTKEHLRSASWWAFGGTLVSLLSAVFGALLGPYNIVVRREVRGRPVVATPVHTPPAPTA